MKKYSITLGLLLLAGCSSPPENVAALPEPEPVSITRSDPFCFGDLRMRMMRDCYFPIQGSGSMATEIFHRTKYKVCTSREWEGNCYCAEKAQKIPGGVRMASNTVYTDYVTIDELQGPLEVDYSSLCD